MRIGINLYPLTLRGGGMRHYMLQLLNWLPRLSDHEFILFYAIHGQPSMAKALRNLGPSERSRVRLIEIDDQEQIFGFAREFDVFFCPLNGFAPNLLDRPTVGTLADVQDQFFPQYFSEQQLEIRRELYPYMARAVTRLLTISEFSKQCICRGFGVPEAKVSVTYLSPSDDVLHGAPRWPGHLEKLPERYVFFPANLYPHKNHELLLQSMRLVRDDHGMECHCILTGHEANPGTNIQERIAANGIADRVRWLGHVDSGAIRHLYEHAAMLAFPSQFEGFGMPLVEAMYCGCPVLATPNTCIGEIVGDAALLVDATPDSFAQGMAALLNDKSQRDRLVARGRERAKLFDSHALAEKTLAVIEEAVQAFGAPAGTPDLPGVSFVVQSTASEPALLRTLTSLNFSRRDQDEIVVLEDQSSLGPKTRCLCENMEGIRIFSGGLKTSQWLDQLRTEIVCVLRAGEQLCDLASQAASEVLQKDGDCKAVLGQSLDVDELGNYRGSRFVAAEIKGKLAGRMIAPASVFWRRSCLQQNAGVIGTPYWTNRLLESLAAGEARTLYRTMATVGPAAEEAEQSLTTLARQFVLHGPAEGTGKGAKRMAWSILARQLSRSKSVVRSLARMMPGFAERGLRGFYRRNIRPYVAQR